MYGLAGKDSAHRKGREYTWKLSFSGCGHLPPVGAGVSGIGVGASVVGTGVSAVVGAGVSAVEGAGVSAEEGAGVGSKDRDRGEKVVSGMKSASIDAWWR